MKLPIYFISDNHFLLENNAEEKIRRKKLLYLFEKIKISGGTLIIGGDFFDFWLQTFKGIPKYYNDLLEALKDLHDQNINIHFIAGNHDYWDFGILNTNYGCNMYKNDFVFNINGNKILVTHGDGILKNDSGYRLMKRIIRSKLFIFLIRIMPISIMTNIAKKISNTKKKFDPKYPKLSTKQKQELKNFAFNKMQDENIDVLLMGHYHEIGIYKNDNKQFIHMGDWINQYTVTILDEKGIWKQKKWEDFKV
tara:strand:- start:1439 stop:2191 length:753 start_codon:yes stop_codon:yes gene_type:complete